MASSLVKEWLAGIGLALYSNAFLENGYDDLQTVATMRLDDFKACGVTLPGHLRKLELAVSKLNEDETAASSRDVEIAQINATAPVQYDGNAAFRTHKWGLSGIMSCLECLAIYTVCLVPSIFGCYETGSNHVICRQCKVAHKGSGIKECILCGICAECVVERRGGACPSYKGGGKSSCFGTYNFSA